MKSMSQFDRQILPKRSNLAYNISYPRFLEHNPKIIFSWCSILNFFEIGQKSISYNQKAYGQTLLGIRLNFWPTSFDPQLLTHNFIFKYVYAPYVWPTLFDLFLIKLHSLRHNIAWTKIWPLLDNFPLFEVKHIFC